MGGLIDRQIVVLKKSFNEKFRESANQAPIKEKKFNQMLKSFPRQFQIYGLKQIFFCSQIF